MKPPGENEIWSPPRLRARLTALKGLAPAPACYVVWRGTSRANGPEVSGYELPGEPGRGGEPEFERWLVERGLAGAERLSVSVLAIREQLDAAGLIRDAVLERRRGDVDGPYHGNVARVEFTGAAKRVRRYRALRDGRLAELPAQDDIAAAPPPMEPDPEGFAGEDEAVHAYLGVDAAILDRRAPTLFEDLIGLGTIIHARRPDGVVVGCGVGWHGGTAFVLAADFPHRASALVAAPDFEAAVTAAIRARDLIRHETRLDELGFCVIARERGQPSLVTIRPDEDGTRIDSYTPGRDGSANEDQRRWMTYAETYEARAILDAWPNGDSDELAVLTIDPDQEAWRHIIDADGIEVSRQPDNEAAAAVLYRERINPPEQPTVPDTAAQVGPRADPAGVIATEDQAASDSLLTRLLAWTRVTALLDLARETPVSGGEIAERLRDLVEPLTSLNASFTLGSLNSLIAQTRSGVLTAVGFAAALRELAARLRDELALTRIVILPSVLHPAEDEAPFGPLVEAHFPTAAYDIEEAVHCLVLRRSTASVLHAMKVMREGLTGAEHLLSTQPLADLAWPQMIASVREKEGDRRDLSDALSRVRRAWRAPGLLPAGKYTEEEAEAVLAAVASFMRALAARFDARGERSPD